MEIIFYRFPRKLKNIYGFILSTSSINNLSLKKFFFIISLILFIVIISPYRHSNNLNTTLFSSCWKWVMVGLNIEFELRSGLKPTVWNSSVKMIRSYGIKILMAGGMSPTSCWKVSLMYARCVIYHSCLTLEREYFW